jgi:parallel beta-helix repeat protein
MHDDNIGRGTKLEKNSSLLKRTFILGVIVILFVISIIPSSGKIVEKHSIKTISDDNILYVGGTGPGNYTKIQLAINEAYEGDTVFVYDDSSPYNENLIVDKSINLIGEDWETTIIIGVDIYESTIHIIDDWINVSGFTVKNGYGGIRINSNNNTISGNIVQKNSWGGVSLQNANFNNILNNKIIDNFYGIQIYKNSCYNYFSSNLIRKSLRLGIMIGNPIVPLPLTYKTENLALNSDNSYFNIFIKNTLINPIKNAYFFECHTNTWDKNYWGRPRILPKIISGYRGKDFTDPWYNIDWHPAFLPYHKLF